MVDIYYEDIDSLTLNEEGISGWLESIVRSEEQVLGPLTLIFCSDDFLLDMNREHLNHDYFTDIITFNYCDENTVSGDLFISLDRVKDNAATLDVAFEKELLRVCAHGVLHLLGFNDKTDEEVAEMRSREDRALSDVNFECFT